MLCTLFEVSRTTMSNDGYAQTSINICTCACD